MSRSQSSERWAVEHHIKGIVSLMNEVETDVSATELRLFAQTKRNAFLSNQLAKNQEVSVCKRNVVYKFRLL